MKEALRIGVVGTGAIGMRAALLHLSLPDVQDRIRITAVCDTFPGRAEAAARKFGVPKWYTAYEELLADPDVDAVTICTPIGLHYQQGMMAVQAGKHIHFNKTMTTTTAEADSLITCADEKGVVIVASPGMMLHPHNQRIRRLVLEGALGRLAWTIAGNSAVGDYHMNEEYRTGEDVLTDVSPAWYFQKPGGGPQYDVTVYCLHNLTGILGPVKHVTAYSGMIIPERNYHGEKIDCNMDDTTMLMLDFGSTLFGFVSATVTGQVTEVFQPNIYGTQGQVIGTKFGERDLKLPGDHMPHVTGQHIEMAESHVFEDLMQLSDWVRLGKQSIANAAHARHVIEIIEAGYRAAETGQTQALRTTFDPLPLDELCE